nr:MAG TPA: hypothetical protein [Caudoviricetes sp.]
MRSLNLTFFNLVSKFFKTRYFFKIGRSNFYFWRKYCCLIIYRQIRNTIFSIFKFAN